MAIATRQAEIEWVGPLATGAGTLSPGSRGSAADDLGVAHRAAGSQDQPGELIAAVHTSCYAMALSLVLGENNTPVERIAIAATCTLDDVDGAPRITTVHLNVRAWMPALKPAGFEELAARAEELCPVSNALRGNVQIHIESKLEQ